MFTSSLKTKSFRTILAYVSIIIFAAGCSRSNQKIDWHYFSCNNLDFKISENSMRTDSEGTPQCAGFETFSACDTLVEAEGQTLNGLISNIGSTPSYNLTLHTKRFNDRYYNIIIRGTAIEKESVLQCLLDHLRLTLTKTPVVTEGFSLEISDTLLLKQHINNQPIKKGGRMVSDGRSMSFEGFSLTSLATYLCDEVCKKVIYSGNDSSRYDFKMSFKDFSLNRDDALAGIGLKLDEIQITDTIVIIDDI